MLWNTVLADSTVNEITVHSSLYAVEVYKKLGFVPIADLQEDGGIQYIPMSYCCYSMDKDHNRRGIIK